MPVGRPPRASAESAPVRLGRGGLAVLLVGASALLASPAAASADANRQVGVSVGSADWSRRTASVQLPPAELVRRSGQRGEIRLSYAQEGPTGPIIGSHTVRGRQQAQRSVAALQNDARTIAVSVDAPRTLDGRTAIAPTAARSADPDRAQQWAMDRLKAETVWNTTDGAGIVVAVLDSGVADHPDLAGAFVPGKDLVDSGGSGRKDPNGHGTHVAGIIAMTANNNTGGAGLAPGVSIMPVRVATSDGIVYASTSARGLIWATDHGAQIINMSYSGTYSPVEETAVEYALSKGVTLVAAAGNDYLDAMGTYFNPVRFPAGYGDVLGVAAYNRKGGRAFFSEVGDQIDLAAPGGGSRGSGSAGLIFSTYNDGSYTEMQGTSMAAPYVSAAAALTAASATRLGLTVNVADVLMSTATDMGAPGVDPQFGYGGVNPQAAVTMLTEAPKIAEASRVTLVPMDAVVRSQDIRFRVPAKGSFEIAVQTKRNAKWTRATLLRKAPYRGARVYTLRSVPAGSYRFLARVAEDRDSNPVWYSPVIRVGG